MSYIGENVAVADFSKQTFTANSSTTVFTLSSSVANSSCLIVSVGGVIQEPDVAYTASGTTLTFSVAPTTGNDVYVIYIGKELPKTTHGDNTITNALIPDGSITNDKIQSLAPSKLTGALPAIDGSALTGVSVNTDSLEDNIALLGFKLAANNALAKYNLVDRTIDEYQDATGIDASASTNESAGGTGTGKYYHGESLQAGTLDSTTDVLLHFDEATFVDSSTHSRTVSNSVGSRSATKSKFGGYSLRTTTSPTTGLTVTHTTTKTLCDAFTIDYWFNFDAVVDNQYFYWGTADLHWGMRFSMPGAAANKMQWYLGPGTGDWTISAQSPGTQNGILGTKTDWVAGQWYHHAQVYDGTSYKMYVDGVQDGDALVTSDKISNGVGTGITQSYVGRNSVGSFNGYFDEFRISSGARWTSNFTPPTTAYPEDIITPGADMNLISTSTTASTAPTKGDITVLIEDNLGTATINTDIKGYVSRNGGTGWDQGTLVHEGTWGTNKKVLSFHDQTFSNSASGTDMKYKIETANQSYTAGTAALDDASSGAHVGTAIADATSSTAQKKFGTASLYFDGTGDYITYPAHADFNSIGTGDYTIESWVYPTNTTGNQNHDYIMGTNSWDGSNNYSWFLGMSGDGSSGTSRKFQFPLYNGGSNPGLLSPLTYAPNVWYHIAVVRSGSTTTMYVNGTAVQTLAGNHHLGGTGVLQVGNGHGTSPWQGYIDELRISNTARYTGAFTPSTTAFTSDANTKFLLHGEEGAPTGKQTRIHATSLAWS